MGRCVCVCVHSCRFSQLNAVLQGLKCSWNRPCLFECQCLQKAQEFHSFLELRPTIWNASVFALGKSNTPIVLSILELTLASIQQILIAWGKEEALRKISRNLNWPLKNRLNYWSQILCRNQGYNVFFQRYFFYFQTLPCIKTKYIPIRMWCWLVLNEIAKERTLDFPTFLACKLSSSLSNSPALMSRFFRCPVPTGQ